MGTFKEEITLENSLDRGFADHGYIEESQIRRLTVEAIPDTGAWTLVINEDIRQKLGLAIQRTTVSSLADGKSSIYPVTEGVSIQWKNRYTLLQAVVVANAKHVLLGALALEAMDLIVDPVRGQLTGAHGDEPLHLLL